MSMTIGSLAEAAGVRAGLTSVESKIRVLERLRGALLRLVRDCEDPRRTHVCPVLAMLDDGESR